MNRLQHLAIIMDGNGRWAQSKGHARSYGHIKGTRVAKKIITDCSKRGIKWLTLYAFSSENWLRPSNEVGLLMLILKRYLIKEADNLKKENIRLSVVGDLHNLPSDVLSAVQDTIDKTSSCTGLNLIFCLSYGARQEITAAVRSIAAKVSSGQLHSSEINEQLINEHLWTYPSPPPDLILRTSGEQRLSNFLLWQAAYSEFYFTNTLWPNFTVAELEKSLKDFENRSRRFGKTENLNDKLSAKTH
jgi:undecaprenyl diphosphate synthase